jgi:hypothetical protein
LLNKANDALERQLQAQQTQSIASNLIANNININTNKTTTIVGSNLQANANNADNADNAVEMLPLKPPEFVPYTV